VAQALYIIALFFLLSKLFFLIGKRLPIINFINKEKFTRCIYIGQGQEKTEEQRQSQDFSMRGPRYGYTLLKH
jgi:hypothetical protein